MFSAPREGIKRHNEAPIQIMDAVHSDTSEFEERAGIVGRALIAALERTIHLQSGVIEGYVAKLRKANPHATPAEIQKLIDRDFKRVATGSGATAGLASAVPGLNFTLGLAAVGSESVLFLDLAACYVMASAHLRGINFRDPERRRALILVVLLGANGTMLVDAAIGDIASANSISLVNQISRLGGANLSALNKRLLKKATTKLTKKYAGAWIGKILPLGVGAVVGSVANRKIAEKVIGNARQSLGAIPREFQEELIFDGEVTATESRPGALWHKARRILPGRD